MSQPGPSGEQARCGPTFALPRQAYPVRLRFYNRAGRQVGDAVLRLNADDLPCDDFVSSHVCLGAEAGDSLDGRCVAWVVVVPSAGETFTMVSAPVMLLGQLRTAVKLLVLDVVSLVTLSRLQWGPWPITFALWVAGWTTARWACQVLVELVMLREDRAWRFRS